MAKAIKAIQCPKCGSTQKIELRADVFRCGNCDTEYYLDNDDINVNYTVRQPMAPPPVSSPTNWLRLLLAAVVALAALRFATRSASPPAYPAATYPGTVTTGAGVRMAAPSAKPANAYSWHDLETRLCRAPGGRAELLLVGTRRYDGPGGESLDSCYASFRDAATGAVLRNVPLPGLLAEASGSSGRSQSLNIDFKTFSNGEVFVIVNKSHLLRANPATHTCPDVTKTLLAGQPELTSGVASLEAVADEYGDGFRVFTNDGRTFYFYPRQNRVYTEKGYFAARIGPEGLRPGSPVRTDFAFSHRGTEYPDEKIQLLRYQFRANEGGPQYAPSFEWADYYGPGSGVFTDADPHRKLLLTPEDVAQGRIVGFADFTPGRLYFEPAVLWADADFVLIRFRPTAAENSPFTLQCLNARTAALVFTLPLPAADNPGPAVRYAEGFVVADHYRDTYTISQTGTLVRHVEIK